MRSAGAAERCYVSQTRMQPWSFELTEDVALVPFDALTRAKRADDQRGLVLERPAERNALWAPEAQREKGRKGWSLRFDLTTGMRLQRRACGSRRRVDPGEPVVRLVDSARGALGPGFREL